MLLILKYKTDLIVSVKTPAGPDTRFGFGGGQVDRRRRKDRGTKGAENIWGWSMGRGAFCGPSRVFVSAVSYAKVQTCITPLTSQADCGSIKGAGVYAEEGTEHYLPW